MVVIKQIQSSLLWLVRTIRIVSTAHSKMTLISVLNKTDIRYEKVDYDNPIYVGV